MREIGKESVAQAIVDTLETMAFVTCDPAESFVGLTPESVLASIAYSGSVTGRLMMLAPRQLGAVLLSNIVGDDGPADADLPARRNDALCEMMNVACGALLREVVDASQSVQMGLPELREPSPADLPQDGNVLALEVDGMPVLVWVSNLNCALEEVAS